MSLTGGKRKVNKSLKAWVAFVKKVQKEEKLSYKDAIHRAKVRKDKGEKWMKGGSEPTPQSTSPGTDEETSSPMEEDENMDMDVSSGENEDMVGGKRRRRTSRRKGGSRKHRKSRRHRRH